MPTLTGRIVNLMSRTTPRLNAWFTRRQIDRVLPVAVLERTTDNAQPPGSRHD